jgi:hypothetical protein
VLGLGRGFIYVWGKCAVEECGSDCEVWYAGLLGRGPKFVRFAGV